MTNKKLNEIVLNRVKQIQSVLTKKGIEYTSSTSDRLINFKIAADYQQITNKQALMGMLAKHLASISQMIKTDNVYSNDVWNEKIGDAINYLILLEAMVYEENDNRTCD